MMNLHFKLRASLTAILAVSFLSGCASYTDEIRDMSLSYKGGQYEAALRKLDSTDLKTQERNSLLYLLERSMILDRLGQRKESRGLLLTADKLVDRLFTTSVSKEIATYVYNEGAQAYGGEDYEKVAIHAMLAHSFVEDNDFQAARVEAAKINTRLNEINNFYEENKNKYKEDAYARYLSGVIYEALGELDSAIVDYKAALKIYETDYQTHFDVSTPRQLPSALAKLLVKRRRGDEAKSVIERYKIDVKTIQQEGIGELIVLHEVGTIAQKEKSEFIYPIGGQVVRFSFPVVKKRSPFRAKTAIAVTGEGEVRAELMQNFDSIAYQCLEDRRGRILAKSAARLILKGQITQKAEKEFGPLGYLAATAYGAITETADTRSWTLLPSVIEVSRISLKPGSYEVAIWNNGRQSGFKTVTIKSDKISLLRDAN